MFYNVMDDKESIDSFEWEVLSTRAGADCFICSIIVFYWFLSMAHDISGINILVGVVAI